MEANEKKIESDISFPDIALFAAATIKVRNFQSSMDSLSASLDSFDTEGLDFGVDGSDVVQVKSKITTLCDTADSPVNETYEALVKTSELLMAGMDLSSVDSLFDGTEILSFIGNDVEGCLETADKCNELAAEYYNIMQKKQEELNSELTILWENGAGLYIGKGTLEEFIEYTLAGNTSAHVDEQKLQELLEMNNDVIGITAAMAIFKQLANINEQKAFDLITELPDYDANSDARIASSTTEINQSVLVDGNWIEIHTLDEYIEWLDTRVPPPEDWERAQMIQGVLTDSENNDTLNIIYYDKDGNIIENPSALDLARYIRGNDINIDNLFLNSDENSEIVEYITRFLPYLDEQQLKTLSYLSNTNSEYYDEYYKMCQATVNQKIGHEDFETLKALLEANDDASYWPELLGDCAWLMGAGLADGLENFFDGFGNVFSADGVLSSDQYKTMELMKYLADEHKDDKFKETVKAGSYEIMSSVANMYVPYLVACIPGCQPIALAMFGASIYGNARDRGLSLGMSEGKATLYALTDAGLELGLMYVLGGIAKFGGEKSLAKLAANKAPQLAWLFRGLGETTEESLQAIIDQLMTEGKLDAAGGKEALKDGAYGFIISLIFGGFAGEPVSLDTKIEEMGSTTRTTSPDSKTVTLVNEEMGIKKTIERDSNGNTRKETIEYKDGTSKVNEFKDGTQTTTEYDSNGVMLKETIINKDSTIKITEFNPKNGHTITYEVDGNGTITEIETDEDGIELRRSRRYGVNSPERSATQTEDSSTETSPADSTDTSSATTETEASPAAEGSIKSETSPEKEAFAKATDFVPPRPIDAWSRDIEFTETATNLDEIKEYVDNHQGRSKEYILLYNDARNNDNFKSIRNGYSLVTFDEYKKMAESSNFYIENATVYDNGLIKVEYEMIRYNSYPLVEPNPVVNPDESAVAPGSKPVAVPDNGTGTPAVNPETSIADTADTSPSADTESNPAAINPEEVAVAPVTDTAIETTSHINTVTETSTADSADTSSPATAEVTEVYPAAEGSVKAETSPAESVETSPATTETGETIEPNSAAAPGSKPVAVPDTGTGTPAVNSEVTEVYPAAEGSVKAETAPATTETGEIIEPNSETTTNPETNPVVNSEEVAVAPVTDTATETTSHINPVTETTTESTTQTSTYIHPVTNDRPHLEQPIPSVEQPKQPVEQPKPPVEQPKPPVEQPKTEPGDTTTQTVVPPNTGGEGQTKRILVADCSPHYDLVTAMNTLVRQNKMVTVTSQEDCLYKLQSNIKFSALFMDESLLEKNGKEFFAQVKGIIPFGVPIILVGNKKYLELGFDGHVSKPINIPNLAQYLSNFI